MQTLLLRAAGRGFVYCIKLPPHVANRWAKLAATGAWEVERLRARLWTVADSVMLLLFAFAVVVQYNDPDPIRWAVLYALAAVACGLSLARRLRSWFPAALAGVALVWAGTIAPRVIGDVGFLDMFGAFEMESVAIEESREMYGLVLIAGWMTVLSVRAMHGTRRSSSAAV